MSLPRYQLALAGLTTPKLRSLSRTISCFMPLLHYKICFYYNLVNKIPDRSRAARCKVISNPVKMDNELFTVTNINCRALLRLLWYHYKQKYIICFPHKHTHISILYLINGHNCNNISKVPVSIDKITYCNASNLK